MNLDFYVKNCNCCDIHLPRINNKGYCASNNQSDCLDNIKSSTDAFYQSCVASCPQNCEKVSFSFFREKTSMEMAYYFTNNLDDIVNYVKVSINYRNLLTTYYVDDAEMPFAVLIGIRIFYCF